MAYQISRHLASQIVDAVKDVCEKNINFITPEGEIIASTDPRRIGTYHEIARLAAQSGTPMEIHSAEIPRKWESMPIWPSGSPDFLSGKMKAISTIELWNRNAVT